MEIIEATYLISSPSLQHCPKADRPEFAFIGRSNVGKSSLINMITGKSRLAKTSNIPGKTQLINHFRIISRKNESSPSESWYMVDLPGYGFAKRSKSTRDQWEKMTKDYILGRENLLQLFLLVDGRHPPQKIDMDFVRKLYQWQVGYSVIFTKSDKVNQREVSKNVSLFSDAILQFQQFLPRMIITSAVRKKGGKKVLEVIEELSEEWR